MKQRFSTTDVTAEVACLRQRCLGMRVANVYDLNPKTYLLKLARSGEEGEKIYLLLESGTRFHTTQVLKERPPQPSNFCLKLRKHVRTRRLEDVRQLGVDRIVDFTFGTGPATVHLILELYSSGNVILTDGRYEVLTLLRSHRDDARGMATMPRHPYPLASIRLATPVTADALAASLRDAPEGATLRGAVTGVLPFGPQVADHCLLQAGLPPLARAAEAPPSPPQLEALLAAVTRFQDWVTSLDGAPPPGYIGLAKPGESRKQRAAAAAAAEAAKAAEAAAAPEDEADLVYDDYEPLQLVQQEGRPSRPFPTFDAALDEFYSKVEGQRADVQQAQAKRAVLSKLDKTRADQEARAEALGREADLEEDQASLIEYNLDVVDAAINALNAALARGLDWRELAALIESEKAAGNPVAATVAALHLERNAATLLLRNELDLESDSDDDAQLPAPTRVEVDLGLNAAANARMRHEARKRHTAKQRRTVEANARALAAAEKRTAQQLAQVEKQATTMRAVRRPEWFERFAWFVSSENYLVLSAHDAQQSDLLVKRYLRKGDVYVHADLKGSPVTIIKNNDPSAPVPPLTISQAGAACVCRSAAWDAKIVTSAWWAHAEQVSKEGATGELLAPGAFTVKGTRHFLPPHPLVMGLGFLFVVDAASAAAHAGERAVKSADAATPAAAAAAAVQEETGADSEDDDSVASQPESDSDGQADAKPSINDTEGANTATAAQISKLDLADDIRHPRTADAASSVESNAEANRGQDAQPPSSGSIASSEDAGSSGGAGTGGLSALEAFLDGAADPRAADFARYGLVDASAAARRDDEVAGHALPAGGGGGGGKRHVSAAARRAAKKQGLAPGLVPAELREASAAARHASPEPGPPPPAGDGEAAEVAAARAAERARREAKQAASQAPAGVAGAAARGARGKAKKAGAKYANQDEEDRRLAMEALASAGSRKAKGDRKEMRRARRDARRPPERAPAPLPTEAELAAVNARPVDTRRTWGKAKQDADAPDPSPPPGEASNGHATGSSAPVPPPAPDILTARDAAGPVASDEADPAPAEPAGNPVDAPAEPAGEGCGLEAGGVVAEEIAAEGGEGGGSDREEGVGEGQQDRDCQDRERLLQLLASMTGMPREGDEVLHAVPVCAPYQVLAPYRHKVKLTPGSQKKGKAARQAATMLARARGVIAAHSDALRAVPDTETIAVCLGGVKMSVPGMQAAKAAVKRGKKSQK